MRHSLFAKAIISLILIVLIIFLPACEPRVPESNGQIALLIDQPLICERNAMIVGANTAAREGEYEVKVYTVESLETAVVDAAIQTAIEDQAQFLIIALSGKTEIAIEQYGLPYISIGTDYPSNLQVLHIDNNDVIVGDMMAKQVIKELGLQKSVILVAATETYGPDERVESGLRLFLGYSGYTVVDRLVADAELPLNLYRSLTRNEAVTGIVTLTAESTITVARLLHGQNLDDLVLVGTGLDYDTIGWVDQGVIDSLVLFNTYSQGYYAALYSTMFIDGINQIPARKTAGSYVVNSETLKSAEIESYVFSTIEQCRPDFKKKK